MMKEEVDEKKTTSQIILSKYIQPRAEQTNQKHTTQIFYSNELKPILLFRFICFVSFSAVFRAIEIQWQMGIKLWLLWSCFMLIIALNA